MMSELLAVYDGDDRVGELDDRGSREVEAYVFIGEKRRSLGIFPNRIDAMRAIKPEGSAA